MTRLFFLFSLLCLAIPAWASEEIGRQEDSASADGQVLMPVGAVRQDTIGVTTSADGDHTNLKSNNVGRLYTTSAVDTALPAGGNAIGTVGVTSLIPGTSSTNLGKAAGGTFIASDTGLMTLCVRHDVSTTALGVDGTYNACGLTSLGEIWTAANTELPAPSTLTDNMANPTITGIAAYLMCFDGTTWDRCLPGLSDTDDNSVAFSQFTTLTIGETHVSDGTSWIRLRTYLEDVASAGGEQLTLAGTIRQDSPVGTTSADGDFANMKTDSIGRLWVNCGAGCSGGGSTTPTDAFANPTTAGLQMTFNMGWNGTTWDRLLVDGSKFLKVNCATGCAGGASTPSDAFANPTTAGLQMDFNMGWNGTTWDRLKSTTANGLVVDVSRVQGNVTIGTVPGTVVEDAVETAGGTGFSVLNVRRDTATTSSNASGDNSTFNTDVLGLLWTRQLDPCNGVAKTPVPINISTATTTQLVAASASNFLYVCSLNIGPTGGAQNIALIEDDTSACASPTAGMAGGTTAASGWNIAANGGFVLGNGDSTVAKTAATNRYVCLISSAAVQTSGVMMYVLAP